MKRLLAILAGGGYIYFAQTYMQGQRGWLVMGAWLAAWSAVWWGLVFGGGGWRALTDEELQERRRQSVGPGDYDHPDYWWHYGDD